MAGEGSLIGPGYKEGQAVLLLALSPSCTYHVQVRSQTVQAPISSRFAFVLWLVCFTFASKIAADPSASYTSTSPAVPGVYGTNTADGDGVFGSATTGRGVVGASESGIGVQGNAKEGRGVVGVSNTKTGVEGQSQGHVGVWGETRSPSGAGGEFHNNGGGDLIRAGLDGVFRVSNNGDVFVRGQRLGTAGPEGPSGPPGPPGPPGAAVHTIAVCGGGSGQGKCNCTGREIARQVASPTTPGCSVTSDTGACGVPVGAIGVCCVCAP